MTNPPDPSALGYAVPLMSDRGVSFRPTPQGDGGALGEYIRDVMAAPFALRRLSAPGRVERVGAVPDAQRTLFSHPRGLRVLDMPVKFPGSDVYRLPSDLAQFAGVLQDIADREHGANPRAQDYYAYLTVDQGSVAARSHQRKGGAHIDGLQGPRINRKIACEHSYLVSDAVPTRFFDHGFDVLGVDLERHNLYAVLTRQADVARSFLTVPYDLYFFDCYAVHESTAAERDTYRTFLRVLYCLRPFDRLGNTHNPMFDYAWPMVPREIPAGLTDPGV